MRKFKDFVNLDNEEAWLNDMLARGYLLTSVDFGYAFTRVETPDGKIRVDHQPRMPAEDFEDYRTLFADAGWRHIVGRASGGAQYFLSTPGATPEIFSDEESKAHRYGRSMQTRSVILLLVAVFTAILAGGGSLFPDQLFMTPGLWEMQGAQFAGAFALDLVFVILRLAAPVGLIGVILYCLYAIGYQYRLRKDALHRAQINR